MHCHIDGGRQGAMETGEGGKDGQKEGGRERERGDGWREGGREGKMPTNSLLLGMDRNVLSVQIIKDDKNNVQY